MENTYVHAPGKGPFSQMKPTIDKVIFLPSFSTGKIKLVIHCCFCIRLPLVGGKQFILGKPDYFVLFPADALFQVNPENLTEKL